MPLLDTEYSPPAAFVLLFLIKWTSASSLILIALLPSSAEFIIVEFPLSNNTAGAFVQLEMSASSITTSLLTTWIEDALAPSLSVIVKLYSEMLLLDVTSTSALSRLPLFWLKLELLMLTPLLLVIAMAEAPSFWMN